MGRTVKGLRWFIIGLIAVATVINYIDRNGVANIAASVAAIGRLALKKFLLFTTAAFGIAACFYSNSGAASASSSEEVVSLAMIREASSQYELFSDEMRRTSIAVDAAIRAGVVVPVPKDPGGGYTHEQHKRNYMALYGAGLLYRITGESAYAAYARSLLLEYAKLYPTLGPHPAKANEAPGRLFWQSLNDSVWLVYAIQGYDAIRDTLNAADRATIDDKVFRHMADFLSIGNAKTFDRIHNHATWAAAGVGMTGYVLHDPELVARSLKGTDKSGRSGFLAQVDQLFSPDGYYTEGPYYQRYALQPFVVFADAIARNQPELGIWQRRDGVLLKAIRSTIQLTYNDYFFPLNDAMPDKSLKTDELYQAVAIGYGVTKDPGFLSIAQEQGRTVLTPDGLLLARDLAAGKASPFPYASQLFRDGPEGDQGALAVLRSGPERDAAVVIAKNSAMGMGHGHFDKLNWILYDAGNPIVTDYGAARFLNIESKNGGRYLKENESWAKQTVAHNTLVVNETSHFNGDWRVGQEHAPSQLFFSADDPLKASTAEMVDAWPGVRFRRTLVQVPFGSGSPLVLDLLRVNGNSPATYDLPLHYSGHITDLGFPVQQSVAERPVLGTGSGYQHIWVDATGTIGPDNATLTWINGSRFYTYRMVPPAGASVILGESGANDPSFNLRREPLLIERVTGVKDTTFVSLLEPHGAYDPSAETTVASASQIKTLRHVRSNDADLIVIEPLSGVPLVIGIADDVTAGRPHSATLDGRRMEWTGHIALLNGFESK
ncbi:MULTISPECIES: alginate lyase family protein [Erwiniaceae]|uniref:Heparinase II/III family protein n=1 Tax=Enterobacter agglomerans TaxID=549 RepID=A0AAN2FG31_ENTAG|nr:MULTISPECIES: alginate lyase family protein [Erwiniaceae]CAH6336504.1 heparinase II/III family protein [Pantoea agglomerans]